MEEAYERLKDTPEYREALARAHAILGETTRATREYTAAVERATEATQQFTRSVTEPPAEGTLVWGTMKGLRRRVQFVGDLMKGVDAELTQPGESQKTLENALDAIGTVRFYLDKVEEEMRSMLPLSVVEK